MLYIGSKEDQGNNAISVPYLPMYIYVLQVMKLKFSECNFVLT